MSKQEKINALKNALNDKFENKQTNKKDDISGDFSTDTVSYPTVKAVKGALSNKVDKVVGKQLSTEDYTSAEKTKLAGIETGATNTPIDSSLSDISENPVQNKIIKGALDSKLESSDLDDVAFSGSYNDLSNTPTFTIEQQVTADSGYLATYAFKINGVQTGSKINIPKDYLVKSASVETVTTADTPVQGYEVGDTYLDFVINTKDNTGSDEHLYLLVTDLIDTYTADESTLTLSNNQFSVKNGGITLTKLSSSVQTSLGYADDWNSSPAKGITSANINSWNNKSNVTISDIDAEIEDYLDALTTALSS